MDLPLITVEQMKEVLAALRKGENVSLDTVALYLPCEGADESACSEAFHECLCEVVVNELNLHRRREGLPVLESKRLATRQEMLRAIGRDFSTDSVPLQAWSAVYYRYLAPVSFSVETLAEGAHITRRQFSRRAGKGIALLTELLHRRQVDRQRASRLRAYLPPREYLRLFGVERHVRKLASLLQDDSGPRLVSIEGLGGIGKTALAQAVAELISQEEGFDGIYWISARQRWLDLEGAVRSVPRAARSLSDIISRLAVQLGVEYVDGLSVREKAARLRPVLEAVPSLVVVDNLETVEETDSLLPIVAEMAGNSRFLLTTRHSVARYPFVFRFVVPELSLAAARSLFVAELERRGRPLGVDSAAFKEVYAVVGGLPLALKLTAGQVSRLPLRVVLENLTRGTGEGHAALYAYIYRRTWMMLDDAARRLLLSMLWVSTEGETIRWLQDMSGLTEEEFFPALAQLQEFSLLETTGSLDAPAFHLHRLTGAFLRSEVLQQWEIEDTES